MTTHQPYLPRFVEPTKDLPASSKAPEVTQANYYRMALGQMPFSITPAEVRVLLFRAGLKHVHDVHRVRRKNEPFKGLILVTIHWSEVRKFLSLDKNLSVSKLGVWVTRPAAGFRAVSACLANDWNTSRYWELRQLLQLQRGDDWDVVM